MEEKNNGTVEQEVLVSLNEELEIEYSTTNEKEEILSLNAILSEAYIIEYGLENLTDDERKEKISNNKYIIDEKDYCKKNRSKIKTIFGKLLFKDAFDLLKNKEKNCFEMPSKSKKVFFFVLGLLPKYKNDYELFIKGQYSEMKDKTKKFLKKKIRVLYSGCDEKIKHKINLHLNINLYTSCCDAFHSLREFNDLIFKLLALNINDIYEDFYGYINHEISHLKKILIFEEMRITDISFNKNMAQDMAKDMAEDMAQKKAIDLARKMAKDMTMNMSQKLAIQMFNNWVKDLLEESTEDMSQGMILSE